MNQYKNLNFQAEPTMADAMSAPQRQLNQNLGIHVELLRYSNQSSILVRLLLFNQIYYGRCFRIMNILKRRGEERREGAKLIK